jgi:hypothetical protein
MKNTLILCILLSLALTAIAEFRREKGLSLHMLPKRVADLSDDKWGFTVTLPGKVKPGHVLQTSDELIKYFDELSPEIRSNGIWIVTTAPEAYTEAELMVPGWRKDDVSKEQNTTFHMQRFKASQWMGTMG